MFSVVHLLDGDFLEPPTKMSESLFCFQSFTCWTVTRTQWWSFTTTWARPSRWSAGSAVRPWATRPSSGRFLPPTKGFGTRTTIPTTTTTTTSSFSIETFQEEESKSKPAETWARATWLAGSIAGLKNT